MALSKPNTSHVRKQLKLGSYRIRSVSSGKSDVWKQFGIVNDGDKDLDYVACKSCHTVLQFTRHQSGTSGMKRHKCQLDSSQTFMSAHIQSDALTNTAKFSQTDKERITIASANFACQDLRSFETVAGVGFINLVQELLKLQHKHRTLIDAKEILPHPTTVSRQIANRGKEVRSDLSVILQEAFSTGHVSCTGDMWTDSHNQRPYLTLTVHWVDQDWKLCSRVICTQEFDATLKKTGANVKIALTNVFSSYGISNEQLNKCIFTTDRGSNMILALRDDERLDCVAHILNTVLRHTFDEKKDCPETITKLITACKGLVRYIKKSSLQILLKKNVKQSCETRWNSTFLMLESVESAYEDIQHVLHNHAPSEVRRVTAIDLELLHEVIAFLKLFYTATNELEGNNEPTIHLVIPWITKLRRHCQVTDEDCEELSSLKTSCLSFLEEKFNPHLFHKVAIYFNPRQKSMKVLSAANRREVLDYVNDKLDLIPLRLTQRATSTGENGPVRKRQRLDQINEFDDDTEEVIDTSEMTLYQTIQITSCTDILQWWKDHVQDYPGLSIIAKNVLCVMATSAPSERNFSLAGNVVSERRSTLKGENLDNILLINSAMKATIN